MRPEQSLVISSYLTSLLSAGRIVFSNEEAERALGIGHGAFLDAAERLQRKGHLINPRCGFYVAVPPQFLSWGAPPPAWYIDDMMRGEGHPYYVGLLKAAELHGAAQQAAMEFQIITDKRMPKIRAGRSLIAFYYRKNMAEMSSGIEDRKTDTGRMRISCVELTALDLVAYPRAANGLDNIVTALSELTDKIDPEKLGMLGAAFGRAVTQRLGHLLTRAGGEDRTGPLFDRLSRGPSPQWIELDPTEVADPDFTIAPRERDDHWRVVVRRIPEVEGNQ